MPNFRGRSRFKTWLFGIALNHCADAWRKHQRLRAILGDLEDRFEDWGEPDWAANSSAWSAAMVERAEIQDHLTSLTEPERQVLELYYYAELNLPEISRLLHVNLSTLKYRFYQAHRHLREKLSHEPAPAAERPSPRRTSV